MGSHSCQSQNSWFEDGFFKISPQNRSFVNKAPGRAELRIGNPLQNQRKLLSIFLKGCFEGFSLGFSYGFLSEITPAAYPAVATRPQRTRMSFEIQVTIKGSASQITKAKEAIERFSIRFFLCFRTRLSCTLYMRNERASGRRRWT